MATKIRIKTQIDGETHGIWIAEDETRIYWREGRGHEIPTVIKADGTKGDWSEYDDPMEVEYEVEYREMNDEDEAEWEVNAE